jgi:hypothetical protein
MEPGGDEAWKRGVVALLAWTLDGRSAGVSLSQTIRVWVNPQNRDS